MQNNNLIEMKISEKTNLSYNVIFIKLKSKIPIQVSRVSFFVFIHNIDKNLKNPYTPTDWSEDEMCFIIKVYNHNGIPDYLNAKSVGDCIRISNPIQKLEYNANHKNILMVCGGTGVTPMLQILKKEINKSKFTIISCDTTFKDIILSRDIINNDLNVFHVISKAENYDTNKNKKFFIDQTKQNVFEGHITKNILVKAHKTNHINKYDFVYVCGPPAFMNIVSGDKNEDKTQGEISGLLKEMGYDSSNVYKF